MKDQAEVLRKARENFVRKRRAMAEQMMPAGAAGSHFAPNFVEIQLAIEAIDRAIADEEALPDDYAAPSVIELATVDGANVDRDYDPA
ncbi:hypothetical protein [uncultured Enterovirga sp.]|uniref:hypothetical protein n=1 Tax=uncultured Enterovirga sp. TaxID=2026352 RepID=UPI0035CBBA5B